MKDKKNSFLKLVELLDKISEWLKSKTTLNSQDWLIAIIFGVGLWVFYVNYKGSVKEGLAFLILWLTFVAILWYSKETYWLKQVQQKQLEHNRESFKRIQTIEFIRDFRLNVYRDFAYIMQDEFRKDLAIIIEKLLKKEQVLDTECLRRMDNVLSYFESASLFLENNIIDEKIFLEYFSVMLGDLKKNRDIMGIINGKKLQDKRNWEKLTTLLDRIRQ